MVAISGPGWDLAPCLVALYHETDALYPNRDYGSDGSIGDQAHASRDSDHNPSGGYVHALDIDEDLSASVHTLRPLWDHLIATRDPRVKYLIYEGRICKSYASNGYAPWQPQPYTGTNAHMQHLHVSVHETDSARNDTSPWWPQITAPVAAPAVNTEETDMLVRSPGGSWFLLSGGKMAYIEAPATLSAAPDALPRWQMKDAATWANFVAAFPAYNV